MNRIFASVLALATLMMIRSAQAQTNTPLTKGRIVYEQLNKGGKANVTINGVQQTFDRPDRTQRMELLFNSDESLRRMLESDERPEAEVSQPGGASFRMVSASGAENIVYNKFSTQKKTEQREMVGKKWLIEDSISKNNWKLTGESKTILGYTCQQATTQAVIKSMRMQLNNGQMERTEFPDTVKVEVWFATAIPVPGGPEYQGQLPGMILEANIRNGQTVYKAVEISPKVKEEDIKEPKSGTKVTQAEFRKQVDDQMKMMIERGRPARNAAF
ncbi:GLPGLI family protein [Pseudoflavitalea sp. G-6-1-2]|uniref:GLPGLI family protein n=1 Tax=Pseudoflavitalea sp. G-6-1-2 TaxID=2728841 RepID=UPI00146CA1E1|nr:GLPGLI family protein [Pseudoflavitalea sp. G-6-1-2]NML19884.1 GLPGLI family protein [Pseudoflavitalea sp. G-6-1-2]